MVSHLLSRLYYGCFRLGHPTRDSFQRRLIGFHCLVRALQSQFVFRDYLWPRHYKEICYQGEFQQELINVLPFAYWHYCNGTLRRTMAAKMTRQLYFFSPDHQESFDRRAPACNFNPMIPNSPHTFRLNSRKWKQVPLKQHFANPKFVFEKPLLVIANRYTSEWDGPPISFFDIPMLDFLISTLKKRYQIVYNRPGVDHMVGDNSQWLDLHETPWLKAKHPEVILLEELFRKHRTEVTDYNHLQLMVYANANRFVSVHGGTATLASYFGGTNIIFSKRGQEHNFGEFKHVFPLLSGTRILHARTESELPALVRDYL
jgi:hypothetical protein